MAGDGAKLAMQTILVPILLSGGVQGEPPPVPADTRARGGATDAALMDGGARDTAATGGGANDE